MRRQRKALARRDTIHAAMKTKIPRNLVRQRVDIISSVRLTLKSLGVALPSPNSACFAKKCRGLLENSDKELLAMVEPSLQVVDVMTQKIRELDRAVEALCESKYPVRCGDWPQRLVSDFFNT